MTVYVKELEGILTKGKVLPWIKRTLSVKVLVSTDQIKIGDIVIVSKSDSWEELETLHVTVIVFEETIEKIKGNVIREIFYNYDYYYLKSALEHAKQSYVNTIITGSSYGLFGIDAGMLEKEVNLSLFSQDLYYSLKGIQEVCEENENINNIVLCCSYYYFCSDLSKTTNQNEILRVSKVYNPIFRDLHNCMLLPPKENVLYESNLFDIKGILNEVVKGEYAMKYFYEGRERDKFQTKVWSDKSKHWGQLNEEERKQAGKERALQHNKNLNRKLSLIENTRLLDELLLFCKEKEINLVLVVTPASKYYREHLLAEYKEVFYNTLDNVDGIIHLIDLYEDELFEDEDFNDMDHLGKLGAEKMTNIILNILQELNESTMK